MLTDAKNAELIHQYFDSIDTNELRNAFCFFVGLSAALRTYRCHPQIKGVISDFRLFSETGEQEFSFILNKKWLLFYFRLPAVRSRRYSIQALKTMFGSVNENARGEWTVKLREMDDVLRLWDFLKLI
jgi:hypothetical protein